MKLKFSKVVQELIDEIVLLPTTTTNPETIKRPTDLIIAAEDVLRKAQLKHEIPFKKFLKIRRHISLLWEIHRMAQKEEYIRQGFDTKVFPLPGIKLDEAKVYHDFVSFIRAVKQEVILEIPDFVQLVMDYGALNMSNEEIQVVIDYNKKKEQVCST